MKESVKKNFERLVNLHTEVAILNEDIKSIKAELKEDGQDAALLSKLAKAKALAKIEELEESSKALLELISEVS